jgi:hypothetical protein
MIALVDIGHTLCFGRKADVQTKCVSIVVLLFAAASLIIMFVFSVGCHRAAAESSYQRDLSDSELVVVAAPLALDDGEAAALGLPSGSYDVFKREGSAQVDPGSRSALLDQIKAPESNREQLQQLTFLAASKHLIFIRDGEKLGTALHCNSTSGVHPALIAKPVVAWSADLFLMIPIIDAAGRGLVDTRAGRKGALDQWVGNAPLAMDLVPSRQWPCTEEALRAFERLGAPLVIPAVPPATGK